MAFELSIKSSLVETSHALGVGLLEFASVCELAGGASHAPFLVMEESPKEEIVPNG